MKTKEESRHPVQPLVFDEDNVIRFKENKIVSFLFNEGPFDMNQLALMSFSIEDRDQFAQLIGHSTSGFGSLPYANPATVEVVDFISKKMIAEKLG